MAVSANRNKYQNQVELLIRCLPSVARIDDFALKGGTAINLFIRDMPRLSVDIDLVYLPLTTRNVAMREVRAHLETIAVTLQRTISGVAVRHTAVDRPKLLVELAGSRVKLEPNLIVRGSVMAPQIMPLCAAAQDEFEQFTEIRCVAPEDLYAGKLCAALDRQHPRDLFDVRMLLDAEGISDDLFRCFLVYAMSSGRPIHELLRPNRVDLEAARRAEFQGMTREPIALETLVQTREELLDELNSRLDDAALAFMLSTHAAEPDGSLIALPNASELPGLQWKALNYRRLRDEQPEKYEAERRAIMALFK